MGLICGPETSVRNNHFTLRKIPKEFTSHLHHGRRLKSGTVLYCIVLYCIVLYCIVLYCIVSAVNRDLMVLCGDAIMQHETWFERGTLFTQIRNWKHLFIEAEDYV